ncbi:MAG: YraN family protein [Devosiaceae bacterium]|nr:YraN family protein [Devosiaceae bacterium]
MNFSQKNTRQQAEAKGRLAETFAVWFLRAQFFSIYARRVKTPGGEIDIVARRGDLVIFAEVKMRRTKFAMGEALSAVNQRRIISAAHYFLAANPKLFHKSLRFDVIFLAPWTWPTHLKGAFETP